MIYLVQGLMPPQNEEEYRRFIGSPEHLRRMSHHISALNEVRSQRLRSGAPFRMISIGMESPVETITLRNSDEGPAWTDGPFAETKEVMAGFNLIDFPSRDDAVAFARTEHVRDAEYTQVVRGVTRLFWGDSIKSGVSARVFLLRIYAAGRQNAVDEDNLIRHLQRIGTEYGQGRGTIDENNLAWSIAMLEPRTGIALKFADGQMTTVDIPKAPDGRTEAAFVLAACSSMEEANRWAAKIASLDGIAVEVRSVTRYSWMSLD